MVSMRGPNLAASKRQALKPLKDRIDAAESQVTILQAELAKLEEQLGEELGGDSEV